MRHSRKAWAGAALLAQALVASSAIAGAYDVAFTGTVYSSTGTTAPAVGSAVSGSYTIDTDASAYAPMPFPMHPGYAAYLLSGTAYGGSFSSTTWVAERYAEASVEVWDNDLSDFNLTEAGDAMAIGAGSGGIKFLVVLFGAADSFSGVRPPEAAVLASFWTHGFVLAWNENLQFAEARARIDSIHVSAVPDAPAGPMALLGASVLALWVRLRGRPGVAGLRRVRCAPAA